MASKRKHRAKAEAAEHGWTPPGKMSLRPHPDWEPPQGLKSASPESAGMAGLREARRENPLIGDRELGDYQFQVLLGISRATPRASSLTVLDFILAEAQAVPDHAQTRGTINGLVELGYVKRLNKVKSPNGGPPVQMLEVTCKGLRALTKKAAQINALFALWQKNSTLMHRLIEEQCTSV